MLSMRIKLICFWPGRMRSNVGCVWGICVWVHVLGGVRQGVNGWEVFSMFETYNKILKLFHILMNKSN